MSAALDVVIAGERLRLRPGRALEWPAERTLFIADPHFGKAAAFRMAGIAAPDGTARDLARLDALLEGTVAHRLVVLGDFLHARSGVTPSTVEALAAWRSRRPELEIILVRGNHDRSAGDPPASLGIRCVAEPWPLGPFLACHEPRTVAAAHVLAGHVHPGAVLRERNGAGLRVACFVVGERMTLLPAFGGFTGSKEWPARRGERRFAVSDDRVIELGGASARS